ncbi:MAG: siderophore biosynthesis protein [Verrucomicrobiota bacterium]
MSTPALTLWKQFHWLFFINTQGLLVCLRRLKNALQANQIEEAKIEFKTAVSLLRASGASMEMAGQFSKAEYEKEVRPTMQAPQMPNDNFSGLMSRDHSALVRLWYELRPFFKNLPQELHPYHRDFYKAYEFLANSHRAVCKRFVGSENGSIRTENNSAIDILDMYLRNRSNIIAPKKISGCPIHQN